MTRLALLLGAALVGCPTSPAPGPTPTPAASHGRSATSPPASQPAPSTPPSAPPTPPPVPDAGPRQPGPFEAPFAGKRNVYYVVPTSRSVPQRLVANLHGICNPPGYACGYWVHAASERGFLVCPTGNSTCGPGQYNAPTWTEPFEKMDEDLERAIGVVDAAYPGEITRDGAVLTGFSRGAWAAVRIAAMHPGRWPYLVLNEANVALTAASLRASGVRAVALIAGEIGGEIAGERRTVAQLEKAGYPARLWVMPKAGHYYSSNIDDIMGEAIDWVVAQGDATDGGTDSGR